MVGEAVNHVRFGRGVVTVFESPRIEIRFDEGENGVRRFAYPEAFRQFLRCESPEAAERVGRDLEAVGAASRQLILSKIEENRQREERITALRLEQQRKKRVESARKNAERRKAALEARKQAAENSSRGE